MAGDVPMPYPMLSTEISAEHPLLLFHADDPAGGDLALYTAHVREAWDTLPEDLRPYAAMVINAPGQDPGARQTAYRTLLTAFQELGLPVVITIADGNPAHYFPRDLLEELLTGFTCVRGAAASGLYFNRYDPALAQGALRPSAQSRWLADTMDTLAHYGRFIWIPTEELAWARVMANVQEKPLYDALVHCAGYVVPGAAVRGQHVIPQVSSLLGLWLEGAAAQWGLAPDSRWYNDAHFDGIGKFGGADTSARMPSALYRAMVLTGAMTGASVYAFPEENDLWFGRAPDRWNDAIYPTLREVLRLGLIARRDFVQTRVPLAFQLSPATTPAEFHRNLRHIDGVLDQGTLIEVAYGMERPGQVPELIPNRGEYFWVPFVSPYASPEFLAAFARVEGPGGPADAQAWRELLSAHAQPAGEGTAFITRVGRGLFIMNSRENVLDPQTFRVDGVPKPVQGLEVRREGATVALTWPFREGDLSYKVYRRTLPATAYELAANLFDERAFIDTPPTDATVAYAVTALTNEQETIEGALSYGEYLALSTVECRIGTEVILSPVQVFGDAQEVALTQSSQPAYTPWWPTLDGLEGEHRQVAEAVARRIEQLESALAAKDLNAVSEIYSGAYEDPAEWGPAYVRRAWQALFECCGFIRMHRQVRRWDFSDYESEGIVRALLYLRVTAVAIGDAADQVADQIVALPRTDAADAWVTFSIDPGGEEWRIARTDPAFPNMRDLLAPFAPAAMLPPGPDRYVAAP
ncbi:glycoside hydrolase family 98 domain-containing protein [Roseovarius pacificus]|uniref:glycoside hydrolase family 98 domain-containing protein n=1 Tax=Roseovarius pacificus TaxID=337701 RepID=UPI003748B48C